MGDKYKLYISLFIICNFDVKFIYSERATKFCEIFTFLLNVCTVAKSKVKISQNFVAFSEYMNFTGYIGMYFQLKTCFLM